MATPADGAREFVNGPQVPEAANQLLARFSLKALCEALTTAQPTDAEPLVLALGRLAEFDDLRDLFLQGDMLAFIHQGAAAPDTRIRRLIAELLVRMTRDEAGVRKISGAGLLIHTEAFVLDDETGIAEKGASVLQHAVQYESCHDAIFGAGDDGGIVQHLQKRLLDINDIQQIRVLHLFVELGRASAPAFSILETRGAYKDVLDAFFTEDILMKLNSVEVMDTLGSYPRGQELLAKGAIPQQLAKDLSDPMCDDTVRLCVTRLLCLVVLRTPDMFDILLPNRLEPLPQAIAAYIHSTNPTERSHALHMWANVAVHPAGFKFFLEWQSILQLLLAQVRSPQNDVCKVAMSCWTSVVETHLSSMLQEASPVIQELLEKQLLPMALKNLTTKPFPDVRCCSWRLLATLVLVPAKSMAQKMLTSDEIRELLLDFTSETAAEARRAKHEYVQALMKAHGSWVGAFLGEDIHTLLDEFTKQGPFWTPQAVATAVGNQSG